MVAADIPASSAAVSSSMSSSPNRRRIATSSASIGASRLPAGMPNAAQQKTQRRNDFRAVLRRPRRLRPDHLRPQRRPQRLAGVVAVPPGGRAQLVQNPALTGLVRPLVAGRDRLRHRFALGHRQSHPPGLTSLHTPPAG